MVIFPILLYFTKSNFGDNQVMLLKNFRKIIVAVIILLFINYSGWSQTYGLYFSGPEVQKDFRTGLNLSEFKKIAFNSDLSISFDLMFRSFEHKHYGFIARCIFNSETNLDFIYDNREGKNKLLVVFEDELQEIPIPITSFKNEWIHVLFDFQKKENKLIISLGNQSQIIENLSLDDKKELELFFGAVPSGIFTTSEVPAMNIKDVSIFKGEKLRHKWILDESLGEMVTDQKIDTKAKAYNPKWLTQKHSFWDEMMSMKVPGRAGVYFNPDKNSLLFVCKNKTIQLDIESLDTLVKPYPNDFTLDISDPGSFFMNSTGDSIYLFSPGHDSLLRFIPGQMDFNKDVTADSINNYFYFNNYFSQQENRLIVFGGLFNNRYINDFKEYNFNQKKWEEPMPQRQNSISPRYLSALGRKEKSNTFYILGGYGSSSGDPVKNAHHFNNMLSVNLDSKQINKIIEFPPTTEEFSFANSLVFPSPGNDFYALRFSSHKYNSELQLITGDLGQNKLTEVGNKIPYTFQAKESYVDLYFSESLNLFIAVTIYHDVNDQSHIKVYSIYSPPNKSQNILQNAENKRKTWYWIILILSFDVVLFIGFLVRKRIREKNENWKKSKEALKRKELELLLRKQAEGERPQSSIFLFGGFQVFDSDGKDISKLFTPLIRELFLIILLYPIKNGKGISSNKLTEIFWFDKSPQKAANNKAVNLGKLRKILDVVGSNQITSKNGYYSLSFNTGSPKVYVDILEFQNLIQQERLEKEDLIRLLKIIEKGSFLSFITNELFDDLKDKVTGQVIDVLTDQLQSFAADSDHNLTMKILDSILIFDSLNELAISEKCKMLTNQGKHGEAKVVFQRFTAVYEKLYGVTYDKTLRDI